MSPREYLAKHTHEEHETWLYWLRDQWNQPSLTDHYLMNLMAEVRRIFAKNPRQVKAEDFKLKFIFEAIEPVDAKLSPEERKKKAAAMSKARWLGMMTAEVKEVIL